MDRDGSLAAPCPADDPSRGRGVDATHDFLTVETENGHAARDAVAGRGRRLEQGCEQGESTHTKFDLT